MKTISYKVKFTSLTLSELILFVGKLHWALWLSYLLLIVRDQVTCDILLWLAKV